MRIPGAAGAAAGTGPAHDDDRGLAWAQGVNGARLLRGSSPAKAAAAGTIDPCTLITNAEAEAALGMSVTGPETERDGSGVTCTYTHSATTLVIHVGLQPSSPSAIEQARTLYGENAKILSGIGDAAFEGPGRMISGVKNSTFFLINTGAGLGIMSEKKFLALARTVAARL